jgi:hypothetical protein
MTAEPTSTLKVREIRFCPLHPDTDQAESAFQLLLKLDDVLGVVKESETCLITTYDVAEITLAEIEDTLIELGFHLDNSLICRLMRALYHFTEENERATLSGQSHRRPSNDAREAFVRQYQRHRHGCRDDRPQHWREYH